MKEASVTKPVVYDHFGTRNGLLAALYQDFDVRQTALIDAAIAASKPGLKEIAKVIANSYTTCVMTQGRKIIEVLATLSGSPELAAVKRHYQKIFLGKSQKVLASYASPQGVAAPGSWAMLGAADALSKAAVAGDLSEQQACSELQETIIAVVKRSK